MKKYLLIAINYIVAFGSVVLTTAIALFAFNVNLRVTQAIIHTPVAFGMVLLGVIVILACIIACWFLLQMTIKFIGRRC